MMELTDGWMNGQMDGSTLVLDRIIIIFYRILSEPRTVKNVPIASSYI